MRDNDAVALPDVLPDVDTDRKCIELSPHYLAMSVQALRASPNDD